MKETLTALRAQMEKASVHTYYIPTADYHETEYVGDYFKARAWLSGFTGSAGTLVVTPREAGLWTDGRYYLQAEKELEDSGISLFKAGMPDVPTPMAYMLRETPEGGRIGFDGRVVNTAFSEKLAEGARTRHITLQPTLDLISPIWKDRPPMPCSKAWILEENYAGKSRREKLEMIRKAMETSGADLHLMAALDNIMWTLNLRGNDIAHFPVIHAFLVLSLKEAHLFVQEKSIPSDVKAILHEAGVTLHPYGDIYHFISQIKAGKYKAILLNKKVVNTAITSRLGSLIKIQDQPDPATLMKAIKNPVELSNIRRIHVLDGVACTEFMYWVKTNVGKIPISEYSAACHLDELRKHIPGYIDLSFDTISAYGPNGAMMHYRATEEKSAMLEAAGFLLVDSGGHYLQGSTDITRTMVLGDITAEMKRHFTAVVQGNLRLANARFLSGCRGINLDILARGPIWDMALDYRSGTGHGIGYLLNVHEGPNGFRWRVVPERIDSAVLEPGMVTTDEPGIYLDGKYGIRIENELICQPLLLDGEPAVNEYGTFLTFENITYCPIDLDGVDLSLLTEADRTMLNQYHDMVYQTLAPYFEGEKLQWLKTYTRPI